LEQVATASRVDLTTPAATLVGVTRQIWQRDAERAAARDAARATLT
jgi:hypothetical protein